MLDLELPPLARRHAHRVAPEQRALVDQLPGALGVHQLLRLRLRLLGVAARGGVPHRVGAVPVTGALVLHEHPWGPAGRERSHADEGRQRKHGAEGAHAAPRARLRLHARGPVSRD